MFFELLVNKTAEEKKKTSDSFMPDAIANSIREFIYNPDEGISFQTNYRRYEGIFQKDCLHWNDKKKKKKKTTDYF